MAKRDKELTEIGAIQLAGLIAKGTVRAVEATQAHLDRIAESEETVQAWSHLDADFALAQASDLDRRRARGKAIGPLHGVPVGVKDIIEVRGLPCENGTVLDAGRRPHADAAVVTRLKSAGAVILGKTVSTELAVYHPGKTRNPHDASRTPGGSSSGSAAAVAARMVPLAIGSQTNGSIIRPASYCGVFGFKPGRGVFSRRGVLTQSPTLDTVGGFARSTEDLALLADAMAGFDEADPAMRLEAHPQFLATAQSAPPVTPSLAFVRSPVWDQAEEDTCAGFEELCAELGAGITEVDLPSAFERGLELHRTIHLADMAKNYGRYYERDKEKLSPTMRGLIEEGRKILAVDYSLAHDWIDILYAGLEKIFESHDAIVTPTATGEAPLGLDATGSPVFCTLWTYCGVPTVSLPLLTGSNGMPIGVQLVGARERDGRLLRTARWLVSRLGGVEEERQVA